MGAPDDEGTVTVVTCGEDGLADETKSQVDFKKS